MTDAGHIVEQWFDSMPDPMTAELSVFAGKERSGFIVRWAKKGIGFGEYTVYIDNETGEVKVDDECMGPKFITEVFRALCNDKGYRMFDGCKDDGNQAD